MIRLKNHPLNNAMEFLGKIRKRRKICNVFNLFDIRWTVNWTKLQKQQNPTAKKDAHHPHHHHCHYTNKVRLFVIFQSKNDMHFTFLHYVFLHFIHYFAPIVWQHFVVSMENFIYFKNDLTDSKQITCMNEIKLNLRSKTNNSTQKRVRERERERK